LRTIFNIKTSLIAINNFREYYIFNAFDLKAICPCFTDNKYIGCFESLELYPRR